MLWKLVKKNWNDYKHELTNEIDRKMAQCKFDLQQARIKKNRQALLDAGVSAENIECFSYPSCRLCGKSRRWRNLPTTSFGCPRIGMLKELKGFVTTRQSHHSTYPEHQGYGD